MSTPEKKCTTCGVVKPLSEFHRNQTYSDGHTTCCKTCRVNYQREYRSRPEVARRLREGARARCANYRGAVFDVLGRRCVLCGCVEERWLTVDHIHNNGGEHRKRLPSKQAVMVDIAGDPDAPRKYRILCYGCNGILRLYHNNEQKLREAISREHARIFADKLDELNKESGR